MCLEPSPHVKRVKVNALPKVVGFLRILRFPATGRKVDKGGLSQRAGQGQIINEVRTDSGCLKRHL